MLADIERLKKEVASLKETGLRRKKERDALMAGSKDVLGRKGFEDAARAIFDHCTKLIGATSGYVALLSDDGYENEVLFLEAGGLPCTVDPALPMPIRGLRAEAYQNNKTVYDNAFMASEWMAFMPPGHVDLNNVMFAPLVLDGRTVGIMGLANKDGDFTEADARMASGFGELAAIALRNSRSLDLQRQAEAQQAKLIRKLQEALSQVKTLSGLIPICSHCKKIRDDSGYWEQVDTYIQEHSEARFSHGICDKCLEEHYPDHRG